MLFLTLCKFPYIHVYIYTYTYIDFIYIYYFSYSLFNNTACPDYGCDPATLIQGNYNIINDINKWKYEYQ